LQSTLVPRRGITYLEPNRNSMQKPIGGRSVLAVFRVKSMLKSGRGTGVYFSIDYLHNAV
jgi:hypothetical protein